MGKVLASCIAAPDVQPQLRLSSTELLDLRRTASPLRLRGFRLNYGLLE